jgi:hypothetical protein
MTTPSRSVAKYEEPNFFYQIPGCESNGKTTVRAARGSDRFATPILSSSVTLNSTKAP